MSCQVSIHDTGDFSPLTPNKFDSTVYVNNLQTLLPKISS